MEHGKVKRKFMHQIHGKCTLCLANNITLCCKSYIQQRLEVTKISMKFACWNPPNVRYNLLEKLKLSSVLDAITTNRMYENQMLYLQAVIFQAKHKTSSHIQNSQWLNRYTTSTSTKKKIRKDKNKGTTSEY